MSALDVLSRFAGTAPATPPDPAERCELCGHPVEAGHGHVVDQEQRRLGCACRACFLLLDHPGAARGRYHPVPQRILVDPSFAPTAADWARLQIPVGLAFIFFDQPTSRWVACYPSAAGVTQAPLPPEAWGPLAHAPLVRAVAPDVEALLVMARVGTADREIALVPIDLCYALVGLVRTSWRGMSGGAELWRALDAFFADVRARARPLTRSGGGT
jgi:hypothetical protein